MIYSSVRSRELCYAISEKPDREYRYAGVLSDNSGVIEEQDKNRIQIMWGNNHGGIEQINGNGTSFIIDLLIRHSFQDKPALKS